MDPVTGAALLYVGTKVWDKVLDKVLDKSLAYTAENILPLQIFKERLRVVIQNTVDEYSKNRPKDNPKFLSFYNTEKMFVNLLESKIYEKDNVNPLTEELFVGHNLIPAEQEDLDEFFYAFMENVKKDESLRRLFVEESYKEAIIDIDSKVREIATDTRLIAENTTINLNLTLGKKNKLNVQRFDYRQRSTEFLGRDKELKELNDFYRGNENKFSWWVVTGQGGIGKSRLFLEFCEYLVEEGANAGFLNFDDLESVDLNKWNPDKPHLIVVDYVDRGYHSTMKLLSTLARRNDLLSSVKVLIVEREFAFDLTNKLYVDYEVSSYLYKKESLDVDSLEDTVLEKIAASFIKNKNNIPEDLGKIISDIDSKRRPLFAMFVGNAIEKGNHIRDWNQDDLLEFQLENELNTIKSRFSMYDEDLIYKHQNLLILSTIVYGLTDENLEELFGENIAWLPSVEELDTELYRALSGGSKIENSRYREEMHDMMRIVKINISTNEEIEESPFNRKIELHPLVPDVIGEYYVLRYLKIDEKYRYKYKNRFQKIKELAEKFESYLYWNFIRRALVDFPGHESIMPFMKMNKASNVDNRGMYGMDILRIMNWFYHNKPDTNIIEKLWSYSKVLYDDGEENPKSMGFGLDPIRVYLEATNILICSREGDFDVQMKLYKGISNITDKFISDKDSYRIISRANDRPEALEEEMRMLINNESTDAKKWLDEHMAYIQDIPFWEVYIIKTIVHFNKQNEKFIKEELPKILERLTYINENCNDPRIRNETANIYYMLHDNLVEKKTEKLNELYDLIKETSLQIEPIDVGVEKINFLRNIFYNVSIYDVKKLFIYDEMFRNLMSGSPNPRIFRGFAEYVKLGFDLGIKYYNENNIFFGEQYQMRLNEMKREFTAFFAVNLRGLNEEMEQKRIEIMRAQEKGSQN